MSSLKGQLLIAVPHLPDANFYRSVVLIIQHNEDGASGLVLNRPSNLSLEDIWSEISSNPLLHDYPINIGGPVQGPLVAVHGISELAENEIIPNVFLSMQRERLDDLFTQSEGNLKLFSGYSGWGPNQLESELHAGGWLTATAGQEHIYADPDELWKSICEQIGQDILFAESVPIRMPEDPSLN